jgi:hypothetical protein
MLRQLSPSPSGHGFVPGYSKGGRWLSEDRTERPVGAQILLRIYSRWQGVDGVDLSWLLELVFPDLMARPPFVPFPALARSQHRENLHLLRSAVEFAGRACTLCPVQMACKAVPNIPILTVCAYDDAILLKGLANLVVVIAPHRRAAAGRHGV